MKTTITRAILTRVQHLVDQVLVPAHINALAKESDKASRKAAATYKRVEVMADYVALRYEAAEVRQAKADELRQRNANETARLLDRVL